MSTRARFLCGRCCWIACVALLILSISQAHAEGPASSCRPEALATGLAGAVIDGRTFVLDDGREVRLGGIESPADDAGLKAKAALEQLLAGRKVALKRIGLGTDRYGRLIAQVFVVGDDGTERWVQADMLALGHARLAARIGDRTCAAELSTRERAARVAKLGLWGDPYYAMQRAEEPAKVSTERGRFAIVEGKVLSVRESGGTIYVNFGRRWSEDFTVTIAKRNERMFTAAGLDPKSLAGREVRVRGWIEERGGPWVEATRPEQIELVGRN